MTPFALNRRERFQLQRQLKHSGRCFVGTGGDGLCDCLRHLALRK